MLRKEKMSELPVRITIIQDQGDTRGSAFPLPNGFIDFVSPQADFSIMTIKPRCIRGNHYHVHSREILVIIHNDDWSLHWDTGPGTPKQSQKFIGCGAEMIEIDRPSAHALRNDGENNLYMFHIRDKSPDPAKPDVVRRFVVDETESTPGTNSRKP